MRIVLSRKGFDQGSGGAASPVFEDGTIFSLPIPDGRTLCRYGDMRHGGVCVGEVVDHLTGGRYGARSYAHLDPDLDAGRMPRIDGWKPAFGQTGAAQRHLANEGVGIGDLFLFFGWFEDVERHSGRWRKKPGGRSVHALHGWLQVGEILDLSSGSLEAWRHHPWLAAHPHVGRGPETGNTVYVASERLVVNGRDTGFAGAGHLGEISAPSTLTAPGQPLKSVWALPAFLTPSGGCRLSYHGDPARWPEKDGRQLLRSVGRGQEFVADVGDGTVAVEWLSSVIGPEGQGAGEAGPDGDRSGAKSSSLM